MEKRRYDAELVKQLIAAVRGERSLRQFSKDCGVSVAGLSRLNSNQYMLTADMIRRLTSEESGPRGGVTSSMLYEAAGLIENVEEAHGGDGESDYGYGPGFSKGGQRRYGGGAEVPIIKKHMASAVMDHLTNVGNYSYTVTPVSLASIKNCMFDLRLEMNIGEEWLFKFICVPEIKGAEGQSDMRRLFSYTEELSFIKEFGNELLVPITLATPDKKRKVIVVTNSERLFNRIFNRYPISYSGNLGIMLADMSLLKIVNDKDVSFYD